VENRRISLFLVLMVLAMTLPSLSAEDPWLIRGGVGVGKFRIGQDIAVYRNDLGPLEAKPSARSGKTAFYSKRTDLMFLTRKGVIEGITVFSPRYHTAKGIQVGSPKDLVRKTLGAWLELRTDNVVYRRLGLAFTFEGGRVSQIYVVEAESPDPLHGDGFIVAGVRAGNLRIGMPFATVQKTWGPPEEESGNLCKFKNKGIMIMAQGGKVTGVIVYAGDYETVEGVRVGTPKAKVLKIYGTKYASSGETVEYVKKGVGFVIGEERVVQIMVTAPQK
jgi:hypothetical protein